MVATVAQVWATSAVHGYFYRNTYIVVVDIRRWNDNQLTES
jgi:hypothetical protein